MYEYQASTDIFHGAVIFFFAYSKFMAYTYLKTCKINENKNKT